MPCAEERREASDVEELRGVLNAISDFLRGLGPLLNRLVGEVMEGLSGERIGENVAAFYRRLKEAGMPDEAVIELTKRYYEDLMVLDRLIEQLTRRISEGKGVGAKVMLKLGGAEEGRGEGEGGE